MGDFNCGGAPLARTVLTTGTSFVTNPATKFALVQLVGGGAGGGGVEAAVGEVGAAGGGGSGGYADKLFALLPSTAYAYVVGFAGGGGSSIGGLPGTDGGDTTFSDGTTTVTAFGGLGGEGSAPTDINVTRAGGAGGAISTNGDVNTGGAPGNPAVATNTLLIQSGAGGSGPFGGGGVGRTAASLGNGAAASGFGSGGSGAAASGDGQQGGGGTPGVIIITEYS